MPLFGQVLLFGSLRTVCQCYVERGSFSCLQCRDAIQEQMRQENADWAGSTEATIAPDGDVDLSDSLVDIFRSPRCPNCLSGVLITDVVFFGDNVPRETLEHCVGQLRRADGLLVLGSSLQVPHFGVVSFGGGD